MTRLVHFLFYQRKTVGTSKFYFPLFAIAFSSLVTVARGELVSSGSSIHYAANFDLVYRYDYNDCDEAYWYGCDPYWDGCDFYEWEIYGYRSLSYPVKADRYYSVGYFDEDGDLIGSDQFWSYSYSSIPVTQSFYDWWEGCDTFFDAPPPEWDQGLAYAIVTEYYYLQSGDIDEDGVNDEFVISNANFTQQNGKYVSFIDLPPGYDANNSSLFVNFRGVWISLKELADRLGREVAEVVGLVVQHGAIKATVADSVSDILVGQVAGWALSKINPPAETEIAIGFADGDDFVPVYKSRYDIDREAYLGVLDWSGTKIGNGKIVLEGNSAAQQKVRVYRSPAKGYPEESWGSIVVGTDSPSAVRKFYIEGIDPSADMNDVVITLRYVPEKQSVSGTISSFFSPSEELTVYDVQFMKYKESAYTDAANFAAKKTAGTLTDGDLEELLPLVELSNPPPSNYASLEVAKWENAFSGSSLLTNFVELDKDQFVVKIEGFGAGNPNVALSLGTQSDLDSFPRIQNVNNPTYIPDHLVNHSLPLPKYTWEAYDDGFDTQSLTQRPANSGTFYSQPQLLVSDGGTPVSGPTNPEGDDDWPRIPNPSGSGTLNDNYADDPTHSVALGSSVIARVSINGKQQPDFAFPVEPRKTISVNVVVFNNGAGGSPVRSLTDVTDEWKAVAERFAQVGVKINYTIRYGVDPAATLPENIWATEPLTGGTGHGPTDEVENLINGHRDGSADFNVLYVRNIVAGSYAGPQSNNLANGVAYRSSVFAATPTYTQFLMLSGQGDAQANLFTAAHELGHLVGDMGHKQSDPVVPWETRNLMFGKTSNDRKVERTKRLIKEQQLRINAELGI